MRRRIVALFGVLVFSGFLSAASASSQSFHFVVLGDNRTPHGAPNRYEQPQAFFDNIRAINLLRPDFAIDVGDLILGDTDSAMVLKQWEYFDRAVARLQVPLKLVVGNHDVRNSWTARIYQRRYGPLYYSFDHKGCHYVVLNTEDLEHRENIAGAQLEWLKRDLANHQDARHTFVFLHKPIWTYPASNWNSEIHPLLARYNVDAVFAGHVHIYQDCGIRDGVHYFITGGGGADVNSLGEAVGGFHHFMWVSVDEDSVRYAVVRAFGVLPPEVVTTASARSWEKAATVQPVTLDLSRTRPRILLHLRNPGANPVVAHLTFKTSPETRWQIVPETTSLPVLGRDSLDLSFPVQVDTTHFFPLPRFDLVYKSRGHRLLHFMGHPALRPDGFIRRWLVVGPFKLYLENEASTTPPKGFISAYPPEKETRLDRAFRSFVGKVRWQEAEALPNGYVELQKLIQPSADAVAYALTWVKAPENVVTTLTLGSNDGARLWVNDELVYSKHTGRNARPDQDVVEVRFRPGWNKLLLKVENFGGGWGFYVRLPVWRQKFTVDPYGPLSKRR